MKSENKKNIVILTHKFLNEDGSDFAIGGVETIANIISHNLSNSYNVIILQLSSVYFEKQIEGKMIYGYNDISKLKKKYQSLLDDVDLSLFLTYEWAKWIKKEKSIVFQHGIEFDGFYSRYSGFKLILHKLYYKLNHFNYLYNTHKVLNRASRIICVDLNFINYVRATFQFSRWNHKLCYIPNFSDVIDKKEIQNKIENQNNNGTVKVIIPRRFEEHRGVLLFAKVVKKLVSEYSNIQFSFVGDGSQKELLMQHIDDLENCFIKRVPYKEMISEYVKSDICVIPTLWSEGTSLACIEGLAYGSCILTTNVGGLGNLILPNYNGYIVSPTEEELYKGMKFLIENVDIRKKYIQNGYLVAKQSFSKEIWLSKINSVINDLM